jgi:hypothetical protein
MNSISRMSENQYYDIHIKIVFTIKIYQIKN